MESVNHIYNVKSAVLARALRAVLPCAAKETGRYSIDSVLFEFDQDQLLHLVTTDGRSMAHVVIQPETTNTNPEFEARVILPLDFSRRVVSFCGYGKNVVAIEVLTGDKPRVKITTNTLLKLSCRPIEGIFPNWRHPSIIPATPESEKRIITLSKKYVLSILQNTPSDDVKLFFNDHAHPIKMWNDGYEFVMMPKHAENKDD